MFTVRPWNSIHSYHVTIFNYVSFTFCQKDLGLVQYTEKKKGLNAVHRQLWTWYFFTFQRIALQYVGKALLILCVCVWNTHHTGGIQSFFSGLSFSDVNSSKHQLSLLHLKDSLYLESTLSLSSKKTSHGRHFTVIFKSATHIPSQGRISAVLRRPNPGQTGYIINSILHYYKAHVSMTIISSAGAVASMTKRSLLCASAQNLIFLVRCNSQPQ